MDLTDALKAAVQTAVEALSKERYPPSLLKATEDHFDYALKLTTGEVIRFTEATIHGDYVTLHPEGGVDGRGFDPSLGNRQFSCPRGVDVRVDQIVWCADAPEGS